MPGATDEGRPRLWVDRVFAAKGSGTVVTGTLAGGALAEGDELQVTPAGKRVRVRALQSLQEPLPVVPPGSRVAVNLSGISRDELARGDALVRPRQWHLTRTVDASLRVLAGVDHDVSRRGAYHAYIGSGEHPVRMRVLGAEAIRPGAEGCVRLHLPRPLPLGPGDRFVLRERGRDETVGGGEILDVSPVLPASRAEPSRSVDRVIDERGWVDADELERLTGERRPARVGRWVVSHAALAAAVEELRRAVDEAGPLGLDSAALDERQRALLPTQEDLTVSEGRVRRRGAVDPLAGHPYLAALDAGGFSPPEPQGVDRGELRELVRRGMVVERDGSFFAPSAVEAAGREVARLLRDHPEGLTVAQVRDALGTTRKHALPLLALLDAAGVTRRRGDVRVAGPRAPV
jgi:selenocysteine-specific elongation factor